jgi:hypothetical protein
MCALEKEVSALAKANFKLHEELVIKDHETALKTAEVQKPAHNSEDLLCSQFIKGERCAWFQGRF